MVFKLKIIVLILYLNLNHNLLYNFNILKYYDNLNN